MIRAEGLAKRFGRLQAVRGVSLGLEKGQTLALIGESGSGKSTVGRILLRLLEPDAGRVFLGDTEITHLAGEPLRRLRPGMAMVFQDPMGALDPLQPVARAVAEPLAIHRPAMSEAERAERVRALFAQVGLDPEAGRRRPAAFSGGQRQRVVIARALATEPEVLVADEAVSALDATVGAQIVELFARLVRSRGLALLFISHDLRAVERLADIVAVMYLGRIVERAASKALFAKPLHPYTAALSKARSLEVVLPGEPPSPLAPPSGCAFHPRCPLYAGLPAPDQARCRAEDPPLRVIGDRESACHFAERL